MSSLFRRRNAASLTERVFAVIRSNAFGALGGLGGEDSSCGDNGGEKPGEACSFGCREAALAVECFKDFGPRGNRGRARVGRRRETGCGLVMDAPTSLFVACSLHGRRSFLNLVLKLGSEKFSGNSWLWV